MHFGCETMKFKVIDKKENKFLERTEFFVEIDHEKEPTPSAAALQKVASKELNSPLDKTEIKSIRSSYGIAKSQVKIYVWKKKKVPDLEKMAAEKKKSEEEKPKEGEEKPEEKKEEVAKGEPAEKPEGEEKKEEAVEKKEKPEGPSEEKQLRRKRNQRDHLKKIRKKRRQREIKKNLRKRVENNK